VEATYAANLRSAFEAGVFGAPTYVIDGELFWGQDRLELLDAMLASGRSAYSA
jgi:2-hydroxychromene-2-carboxylate isomerase